MDNRFNALISLAGSNDTLADIGCDHGKVSIYIAKNGLAKKVFACDISQPSLDKAVKNAKKQNIDNIEFICADGFEGLKEKPNTAIIAGMGGEVISKIILHPFAETHLVLQPMKDAELLITALQKNGFGFESVKIAKEGRRFYEIFSVKFGLNRHYSYDILDRNETSREFLIHKKRILNNARLGAEKSTTADGKVKLNNILKEIKLIDEVLENAYG